MLAVLCIGANLAIVLILSVYSPLPGLIGSAIGVLLLGLTYPVYFVVSHRKVGSVKLRSGVVSLPRRRLDEEPSDLAEAFMWPLLTLPAWLAGQAIHHGLTPMRVARVDVPVMARAFVCLLEHGKRMSLFDLEDSLQEPNLAASIRVIVHMRGVLTWDADFPAISINDDLRDKLAQLI
jgi:hypothetical protein